MRFLLVAVAATAALVVYAIGRLDLEDDDEVYARLVRGGIPWR